MEDFNKYERISNAYKSKNGLYPHEIIVLSCADKYSEENEIFPKFWQDCYGINNVKNILKNLYERGFLEYAGVDETLKHQKISQIKAFLKSQGLKVSGTKSVLLERVFDNFSEEELEHYFTTKYYKLSKLGKEELDSNKTLIDINAKPLFGVDIWEANQLLHNNPGKTIEDIIFEKYNKELEEALSKKDYGLYVRNAYRTISFCINNNNIEEALKITAYLSYFKLNLADICMTCTTEEKIERIQNGFWNSDSLSQQVVIQLTTIMELLHLDNDSIIKKISKLISDVDLEFELFNKKECALIALYKMQRKEKEIEKIYREARERIKDIHMGREDKSLRLSEKEKIMLDKKEQILLDSFEILKDDVKINHEQLTMILTQLQENQPETVIELWKYLLEKNWDHVVKDKESFRSIASFLTSDLMEALTSDEGFIIFEKYFVLEPKILQAVYQYSPELPTCSTSVIATQIRSKNFENANRMLEYMYANKKNNFLKSEEWGNYCFSNIYKDWIKNYITTSKTHYGAHHYQSGLKINSEEIFEFLSYWADQITDEKEKARTKVFLMELI